METTCTKFRQAILDLGLDLDLDLGLDLGSELDFDPDWELEISRYYVKSRARRGIRDSMTLDLDFFVEKAKAKAIGNQANTWP